MGGLLICLSIVVPTLLWANLRVASIWVALAGLVSFGGVGLLDDYLKIRRKHNHIVDAPASTAGKLRPGFPSYSLRLLQTARIGFGTRHCWLIRQLRVVMAAFQHKLREQVPADPVGDGHP